MENLKNFAKFLGTKQGLGRPLVILRAVVASLLGPGLTKTWPTRAGPASIYWGRSPLHETPATSTTRYALPVVFPSCVKPCAQTLINLLFVFRS